MKRLPFLLTFLLAVAMIAAACGEGVESTEMPPTAEMDDLSAETLETPAVQMTDTMATEPPVVETPVGVVTGVVTSTTPLSPTDGSAATDMTISDPGLISTILDLDVWNRSDEQIGSVEDLIINLGEQKIDYVVVSVGGFLGLGDRDVPVPWDALEFQVADAVTGTVDIPQHRFVIDITKEELEQAPEMNHDLIPGLGEDPNDWDFDYSGIWVNLPDIGVTGSAVITGTTDVTVTTGITGTKDMTVSQLQGVILTSELGSPVIQTSDGEEVGRIEDAVVDLETGEIRYVLLSVDLEGAGTDMWVAVPLNAFQLDAARAALVLVVDRASLQGAPSFAPDQFPNTLEEDWDVDIHEFWLKYIEPVID